MAKLTSDLHIYDNRVSNDVMTAENESSLRKAIDEQMRRIAEEIIRTGTKLEQFSRAEPNGANSQLHEQKFADL